MKPILVLQDIPNHNLQGHILNLLIQISFLRLPRFMSHEKVQERRDYVRQLVEDYHADGVMYEQLKFCEYWGYERALASYVMTNDYGVPTAAVDRQYTASASGQLRTRVQAFVESLEIKKIQKERAAKENG